MDDVIIIMCMRVENTKKYTKGIEAFCLDYNVKVWLSDTSIAGIKERQPDRDLVKDPPPVNCMQCAMKKADKYMAPGKAQTQEIRDYFKNKGNAD